MARIATVTLLVRDYDEALRFYAGALGFAVVEDKDLGGGRRWIVLAPPGGEGARLLLARAAGPAQEARIGDQTGGRVFLFLETGDFADAHARMTAAGVRFRETPRREPYGTVAVFEDLYGNLWDLIEPGDSHADPDSDRGRDLLHHLVGGALRGAALRR